MGTRAAVFVLKRITMTSNRFTWANEPNDWSEQQDELNVVTDLNTDFWRKTYYGFIRDNGHFRYQEISGDFTCEVELVAEFDCLYDQLGLMIRADNEHWVKAGLEYSDNAVQISAVVTNDHSDWSVQRCDWYSGSINIRITRHAETIRIEYMDESGNWNLMRLAFLKMPETCELGMMCCSPERSGFKARFKNFKFGEPINRELHDIS